MLMAALLALQTATATAAAGGICTAAEDVGLVRAAALIERGDDPLEREPVLRSADHADGCVALARAALLAWNEARALARIGGDPAKLGPVRLRLEELRRFAAGPFALEAEYALVSAQAAIAASQDERAELELLLAHARDLSERLFQRQRTVRWPRSFNLLAGELWLEVDRYEDARQAFGRALRDGAPRAVARVGLAEALMRLDRRDEACRALRQVRDAADAVRAQADQLAASCP